MHFDTLVYSTYGAIDSISLVQPFAYNNDYPQKKNNNMTDTAKMTPEQESRKYLLSRLVSINEEKVHDLRSKYGLEDDPAPITPAEMKQRLAEGKYFLDFKDLKDNAKLYGTIGSFLRWRDPAKVEDKDGFDKAFAALHKACQQAMDIIKVSDPATTGLKALQDFEAKTF